MDNLKKLRQERNLSQQQLADILHISQQSIHKYENNISDPDINMLKTMAAFFDTSVDYLIGNTDIRSRIEPKYETMLNSDEEALIRNYRRLSEYHKNIVNMVITSYS